MSVNVVSLAAEFPNDNPALHAGTRWVCLTPLARPTPERSIHEAPVAEPPATLAAPAVMAAIVASHPELLEVIEEQAIAMVEPGTSDEAIVVEDLEPIEEMHVEGVVPVFESIAPPTVLEEVTTSALPPAPDDPFLAFVCTLADVAIRAGSPHVAALLPGLLFDGRASEPLPAIPGVWDGAALEPSFASTVEAWRAILRGTSDDFSDCGMLDEWASELLARLMNAHEGSPKLRQELRARGIAAFGLAA